MVRGNRNGCQDDLPAVQRVSTIGVHPYAWIAGPLAVQQLVTLLRFFSIILDPGETLAAGFSRTLAVDSSDGGRRLNMHGGERLTLVGNFSMVPGNGIAGVGCPGSG